MQPARPLRRATISAAIDEEIVRAAARRASFFAVRGPRSDPQVALGQAIKQTRLARGLSQEQVAHGVDLHPTWISHIEGGSNPAWGTVRRIVLSLGVEVSEIARLAEEIERSVASAAQE